MPLLNQAPKWARNLERSVNLERAAIDVEKRMVPLSFSSETTEVVRWGDVEILDHSPGACDLTRLNDIGVLLFNHNVNMPIGGIDSAIIENSRGKAVARFDGDEQSDTIFKKVVNGTLKATSVRYDVQNWEYVQVNEISTCGRFKGPCYIARKWKPTEISIVSVPADSSVGVGRSAEEVQNERDDERMTQEEKEAMEREKLRQQQPPPAGAPAAAPVDTDAIRAAVQREAAEITALCRDFGMDATEFLSRGDSIDKVKDAILSKKHAENKPADTVRIQVTEEEAVKFSRAAVDAILLRDGIVVVNPAEGAAELRSMRLRDMMIECVERTGNRNARRMSDEDLIRESLTGSGAFPGILSNAANKSMSDGYAAAETTYQIWTGVGSNPDFKAATHYRLSEAGDLVEIKESGEFKFDEGTEEGANKSVLTFGRSWGLSRKAIINDDLSALTRIPARYAAASARGINKLVYTKLATSTNYTGARGNLVDTGSGAVPSVVTIGAGRLAMRKQKNLRGKETLNVQPKYLLHPASLETGVDTLLGSITDPASTNANVKNPFYGKLTPVCDAELDALDAFAWYLAAQAGLVDTIEVTYLNGVQTPTIESQVSFDILGMKWRIYIDYGVTTLDFRGLYKNAGQ